MAHQVVHINNWHRDMPFFYLQNLTLMKTRMEKLQILVGLEEGIQSFKDRIELTQDSINGCGRYFDENLDKWIDDIHTYRMCIKRLEQRFSKVRKTLK